MRANLLAIATVTNRAGFFRSKAAIQSRRAPVRFATERRSEVEDRTSSFLIYRFPFFVIFPSFAFPPLEFCLGVNPSQAAKSRPELNIAGSGTLAAYPYAVGRLALIF